MPDPGSPSGNPHYVPYQAYKPKRHSRNFSNPNSLITPNVSLPPLSQPTSAGARPTASPPPRTYPDEENEQAPSFSSIINNPTNSSPTPASPLPSASIAPSPQRLTSQTQETELRIAQDQESRPNFPILPSVSKEVAVPSSSAPSSPTSSTAPQNTLSSRSSYTPKKSSTFRRLPQKQMQPSQATSHLSPEFQLSTHSRNVSTSSLPISQPHANSKSDQVFQFSTKPPPMNGDGNNSLPSVTVEVPIRHNETKLPPASAEPKSTVISNAHNTPSESAHRSNLGCAPISKNTSSSAQLGPEISSPGKASSTTARVPPKHQTAPYRPGFQPKGIYRQLTDNFLDLRRVKRDGEGESGRIKRIERTKLERRLEKLILLHFPPTGESHGVNETSRSISRIASPGRENRRASFFDFEGMKSIKVNDASDLWRGVIGGGLTNSRQEIRALEQRITPWEEDITVSRCPLCDASFHPLTNRKHHCRLCGKIMCSLPAKPPQRPVTCSLLFIVDSKIRRIEEVGEGVDYGVRRRNNVATDNTRTRQEEDEKFLKGVRICRDCRPIILRQQYQRQTEDLPIFISLYHSFINLEKEIEESLPQFQELILSLSHHDQPTKEATTARKRLLDAFTQYDKLSKKIRSLPCPSGPGSSQDRVQMAVLTRANLFLQKNMFPLQSLPKPAANKNDKTAKRVNDVSQDSLHGDAILDQDSELARALQPLLEQESLLESFIEEARAQRKFEDVKTLRMNYEEIRKEIETLLTISGMGGRAVVGDIPKGTRSGL